MATPYISEIRIFAGNYAPVGFALCNGQLLSINTYQILYSLIGTTYGGDGTNTFALPDLRSRLPLHFGQGAGLTPRTQGETAGQENVTLLTGQMPAHSHQAMASTSNASLPAPGPTAVPGTVVLNQSSGSALLYTVPGTTTITPAPFALGSITSAGGSQPHTNLMPALAVNFIIALEGVYPQRS